MFNEDLKELVKAHLLSHLADYLAAENSRHDKKVTLEMPRTIDSSMVLGGVMAVARDTLPQGSIAVGTHALSDQSEGDEWLYVYNGFLTFIVGANTPTLVETICERYSAACERFIRDHVYFHQMVDPSTTPLFQVRGFAFLQGQLTGAIELEPEDGATKALWVAALQLDFALNVAEDGPNQHGS